MAHASALPRYEIHVRGHRVRVDQPVSDVAATATRHRRTVHRRPRRRGPARPAASTNRSLPPVVASAVLSGRLIVGQWSSGSLLVVPWGTPAAQVTMSLITRPVP